MGILDVGRPVAGPRAYGLEARAVRPGTRLPGNQRMDRSGGLLVVLGWEVMVGLFRVPRRPVMRVVTIPDRR